MNRFSTGEVSGGMLSLHKYSRLVPWQLHGIPVFLPYLNGAWFDFLYGHAKEIRAELVKRAATALGILYEGHFHAIGALENSFVNQAHSFRPVCGGIRIIPYGWMERVQGHGV